MASPQNVRMSFFLYALLIFTTWSSSSSCSYGGITEWHLSNSHTLNVSADTGLLVDRSEGGPSPTPDLKFYPFMEFRSNASAEVANPYCYLCFLSADHARSAFILSICMTSANMDDNFDYHTPIVWSANRQNPARGKLITLTLQEDGDLVLKGDADTSPAWKAGTANKGVVKMELVQNPINLVLYDGDGGVVWQSMDHPTDTITHWQTLGVGKKLVSWASPSDPSEGSYSLVVGHGGSVVLYTSGFDSSRTAVAQPIPYWTSDASALEAINDTSAEARSAVVTVSDIGFISTETKDQLTNYNSDGQPLIPCALPNWELSNKTFLRLKSDGSLHLYVLGIPHWFDLCSSTPIPSPNNCSLPLQCGPYGVCFTGGNCEECYNSHLTPVSSSYEEGYKLMQPLVACDGSSYNSSTEMVFVGDYDYFANAYTPPISGISSEKDCQKTCLANCSCLAAFWRVNVSHCFHVNHWIGSFFLNSQKRFILDYRAYIKIRDQMQDPPYSLSDAILMIIRLGVQVGCIILGILAVTTCICIVRNRCTDRWNNPGEEEDVIVDNILRYTYAELQDITNGFSKQLGKGGFGAVYEGMLVDGTQVAVKRLAGARQEDNDFRSEVGIMAGIRHYHLLRLLGFCAQGAHRLLVYEYMQNGSLDQRLFNRSRRGDESCHNIPLPWDVRFRIAVGAAKGLSYLHEGCQERVIHLDVKPQNVLLDKDLVPKVGDFGLSRLLGREDSNMMITTMRGTPGYMAPEVLRQTSIDAKYDVFGFGMLLLEIISGRKNEDFQQDNPECIYYPAWAFGQAQGNECQGSAEIVAEILTDADLRDEEEKAQVKRMIKTAFLCLLEDPRLRPSMQQVVQMLEGLLDVSSLQLSSLLQGLLSVLRNATAYDHMQETVKDILAAASSSNATMSLELSAR